MTAALLSIGTATPGFELHQDRAAEIAAGLMGLTERRGRSLASLYAQSGVGLRRTALADGGLATLFEPASEATADGPGTASRIARYRTLAPELATIAARDAISRAAVPASGITHLVTVSCTGFHAPGVDVELVRRLGLSPDIQRTTVGYMGCHGAINGLRVAAALASADPNAVVLVCCVEICSVHFQYRPQNGAATANSLFVDGAAACLVSAGPGPHRLAAFGAHLFPDSADEMGWTIGDHGFVMSLSARVPRLLEEGVGPWMDAWLEAQGRTRSGVAAWAIHPGGPRIVESVRRSLGLPTDAVADALDVLRTLGNMSSPTILFILRRVLERAPGGPVAALAFGPGLAGEALLIDSA